MKYDKDRQIHLQKRSVCSLCLLLIKVDLRVLCSLLAIQRTTDKDPEKDVPKTEGYDS